VKIFNEPSDVNSLTQQTRQVNLYFPIGPTSVGLVIPHVFKLVTETISKSYGSTDNYHDYNSAIMVR
jgi:hypothetical protein